MPDRALAGAFFSYPDTSVLRDPETMEMMRPRPFSFPGSRYLMVLLAQLLE
jgi:hypothetical protein